MPTYQTKNPNVPRKPDLTGDQRDKDLAMLAYAKQLETGRRKNAIAVAIDPQTVVITTRGKAEEVRQRYSGHSRMPR